MLDQVEAAEGCEASGDVLEIYGDIDIGIGARLVTSGRAEQRKAHDAKLAQLGCVGL